MQAMPLSRVTGPAQGYCLQTVVMRPTIQEMSLPYPTLLYSTLSLYSTQLYSVQLYTLQQLNILMMHKTRCSESLIMLGTHHRDDLQMQPHSLDTKVKVLLKSILT